MRFGGNGSILTIQSASIPWVVEASGSRYSKANDVNQTDIAHIRLISQRVAGTQARTAQEAVAWMGAIQAQDYPMAKWAVGVRVPGSTDQAVEAAIDRAEIIRTHLLRPTWHLVSADDIYWMLELTAPRIKASMKAREKALELSAAVFAESDSIIEKALRDRDYVTREDLISELERAGIATGQYRSGHLLLRAELDGIACSGPARGGKPTYALLQARVPRPKPLTKEEALATLARRYFTSRSPATLQDFVWWSGLPAGDARRGLEMVKSDFMLESIDSREYWLAKTGFAAGTGRESVFLLPGFDEFIISYRDRSAVLPFEDKIRAVWNGGIFWPAIVVGGQVMGVWKRTIKKDQVLVETEPFTPLGDLTKTLIEAAATDYGRFLGKQVKLGHKR